MVNKFEFSGVAGYVLVHLSNIRSSHPASRAAFTDSPNSETLAIPVDIITGFFVARKLWPDTDGLDGIYNNSYIDSDGTWLSVLVITSLTNKKFQFEWFDKHNGNQDWTGEGWYIKQNQIALKYWK